MLKHRWVSPRLDAYVDRELDAASHRRVEAHLHECWGCSGQVQTRIGIKSSLGRLGRARPAELAQVRLRAWAAERVR